MSAEAEKKQVADDTLDQIGGGNGENGQCVCLVCKNWVTPRKEGIQSFCPVCGAQIGGLLSTNRRRN